MVEQACRAVIFLALNDANVLIAEKKSIPLILAALDKHAEHAGVVEQACSLSLSLARSLARSLSLSLSLSLSRARARSLSLYTDICTWDIT